MQTLQAAGYRACTARSLFVPKSTLACLPALPCRTLPAAEHFVAFLQRFVQHLRSRLAVNEVVSVTPTAFLEKLQEVSAGMF